ncbi:LolA family protein [Hyphomicrobium methylovorum]|uniref:LolA family protein n=1 Tax=Hyphomicrobium methylovorum TaxID=84 RepID=UPI001FE42560|nr:outer-membrane lipoprotein carrier protein LolA [Hyphomicrobium methylovorum]
MRFCQRLLATAALVTLCGGATLAEDANGPSEALKSVPAVKATAVQGWTGKVATAKNEGIVLDDSQTKLVHDVSAYFGSLTNLKGAFVQIDSANKRMRGKFFVKRPGRFRFDYALPSRQVIVSDGQNLAIQDLDLNNEDRVSIDQTPFRLLLRKDVDLLRDAKITEVQHSDDLIVLGLEDKNPDAPGHIKLFIATKPTMELKEWVTTDAQGLDTRIEVSGLVQTDDLDGNLFKIQPLGPHRTTPN